MSTISLPFEDQIRHFFVADGYTAQTSLADFIANPVIGEVAIVDEAGVVLTALNVATAVGDFSVVKLNQKGTVSQSDWVTPKDITYFKDSDPVAKTGKTQDITLSGTIAAGDEFVLVGKVHYGNSEENFITFWAGYQVPAAGATAEAVMDALAVQMATNLANSINTSTKVAGSTAVDGTTLVKNNKYFTLDSSVAGTLSIDEKDWILEDFRVGLKTHDQLMWNFELQKSDNSAAVITKVVTPPVYAKGQGYQMIELERFLVGHRAEFELKDITLSFNRQYDVNINSEYYSLDLKYFDISRDDPKHSDKMLTIVTDDLTTINALGGVLAVLAGTTWTTKV